ncbi:ABC transporter permease [Candidatus Pyrohabitans sp.]
MNLGNLITVSRWELRRSRGRLSAGVVLAVLLLSTSLLLLFLTSLNSPSRVVFYSVGIQGEDSILSGALEYDGRFRVERYPGDAQRLLMEGRLDLLIRISDGVSVLYTPEESSLAALDALAQAISIYKTLTLFAVEAEQVNYAFPLWIQTHYLKREWEFQYFTLPEGSEDAEDTRAGASNGESPAGKIAGGETPPEALPSSEAEKLLNSYRRSWLDMSGITTEEARITLPTLFTPPLPFKSVLLAFIVALPIYLFSQFYSASMLEERNHRRAELLLSSPLSAGDVVAGRMLVYLCLSLTAIAGTAAILRRRLEPEVALILLPVVFLFLSLSLLASVLSRSYRENSFILIFLSVTLFSFLFFPAMFVNVHAVSTISPVSLLVEVFEGGELEFGDYLLVAFPFFAAGSVVFLLATGMFADSVLFPQKPISHRLIYGVWTLWSRLGGGKPALVLLGAAAAVLAYLLELGYIVALFQLPFPLSLQLLLVLAAFSEEALKAGVIAGVLRNPLNRSRVVLIGALCGTGFFLGEKLIAFSALAKLSGSLFWSAILPGERIFGALLLQAALGILAARVLVRSRSFVLTVALTGSLHLLYNLIILGGVP